MIRIRGEQFATVAIVSSVLASSTTITSSLSVNCLKTEFNASEIRSAPLRTGITTEVGIMAA